MITRPNLMKPFKTSPFINFLMDAPPKQTASVRFPNLTRAYGNNDRRPRQKFVFGILQLLSGVAKQADDMDPWIRLMLTPFTIIYRKLTSSLTLVVIYRTTCQTPTFVCSYNIIYIYIYIYIYTVVYIDLYSDGCI